MPVEMTSAGAVCNGVRVRLGVRIGSPLGKHVTRPDHELSNCLNCGCDIWTFVGLAQPGEQHACGECIKAAMPAGGGES